ncbi:hypothetical protein VP01_238g1 [Puccinia sorghi]|uniref:Retrovirus-related Pol polyprotein from transposon TNT 1-94-like beta-barrel domain-containing protein n=1 Tax=Puccinia sorghi TaxID=27349 RepID=A0A0L6V700_9BASI|nr:hypothetical protein VP01_238g1 [Puccinia sorghi]
MSKTTDDLMDKLNSMLYKTAIESIPLLTQENFSMWRLRVINLLDLLKIKDAVINQTTKLSSSKELVLRTILGAKLDATIHSNFFCLYPICQLSSLSHYRKDARSGHQHRHRRSITHLGQEMTPELVLDHLRLHANKQSIASSSNGINGTHQVSLYTNHSSTKCRPNAHKTRAPHPEHQCWMNNRTEQSVSSFHSSLSYPSMQFVLDSGSSAHMKSNIKLFLALEHKEKGVIHTSSGTESLKIKGSGSIKLTNNYGDFILHHMLYVPDLCVNLLSVRFLVLDGYDVIFEMNSFSIKRNGAMCMDVYYINNLPTINVSNHSHNCLFSSGEMLHKALGHIVLLVKHARYLKLCEDLLILDILKRQSPLKKFISTSWDLFLQLPGKSKSEVSSCLSQAINLEARRFGYYPTVIHSDWGTEFINKYMSNFCNKNIIRARYSDAYTPQQNVLRDFGIPLKYWNEVIKASTLLLNQIPAHRSKRSPYELFKNRSLPLDYFKPIGLKVSYRNLPDQSGLSKLAQIGEIGRIIGYNDELCKHLSFLDYESNSKGIENFVIEDDIDESDSVAKNSSNAFEPSQVLEIDEEIPAISAESQEIIETSSKENSYDTNLELIPQSRDDDIDLDSIPQPRILRERTRNVKPVKYSYLTGDPEKFRKAMQSDKCVEWTAAANEELNNIEGHEVWEDMWDVPTSFLRTTWVFKTKPATLLLKSTISPVEKIIFSTICVYIHSNKNYVLFFHIDDLIVAGDVDEFESLFLKRFPNSTAHAPDTLLGMDVKIKNDEIKLHQQKMIKKGLELAGITKCPLINLLTFNIDDLNTIKHYTDATWADDLETHLSRSGSIFFWKACPVAWNSKKPKNIITMSSTEAELNALSDGVQENQWIKFLVEELWDKKLNPTEFHIKNQGLLEKLKNLWIKFKNKTSSPQ